MNTGLRPLCLALSLAALTGLAQSDDEPENRFNLSYRAGFNIKADIKNLGQPGVPGGPSVTGLSYENGFVRPNAVPNNLGLSWNWGYQNAGQVLGDNIVMTSSQAGKVGSIDQDSPAHGVELSYNRRLGWWGTAACGLEAAINYTGVDIDGKDRPPGSVMTAHAFSLGGAVPPVAPYSGTPQGPGILISETPTVASLAVQSTLDTTLLGFRLGPYLDYPINTNWTIGFSGGLAFGRAETDFHFREVASLNGAQTVLRTGSGSNTEWLTGVYIGGNLSYKFCRAGSAFAGVQFQHLGDYLVKASDKQAKLDFSKSIFLNAGISFSF